MLDFYLHNCMRIYKQIIKIRFISFANSLFDFHIITTTTNKNLHLKFILFLAFFLISSDKILKLQVLIIVLYVSEVKFELFPG